MTNLGLVPIVLCLILAIIFVVIIYEIKNGRYKFKEKLPEIIAIIGLVIATLFFYPN